MYYITTSKFLCELSSLIYFPVDTEDKRPSKNLIQLNLPKPLQANIGNCHRHLEDHQVEQKKFRRR